MRKTSKPTELSVIITAHAEGIIAHKTIISIQQALEAFDKEGLSYEIIIHIDNGTAETKDYFRRYENQEKYVIFHNSFSNPSDSRNFAISKAKGRYTALIDGDDLVTRQWLIDGYRILEARKDKVIMRPNYQLQFGGTDPHHNIWVLEDSFTKEEDALIMCYYNRWPNALIGATDLLRDFPFENTKNGYGFEDWLFNCSLRAANIPNIVVPGSTLFYRRRANSVTSDHMGTILPYSPLFDIDYVKSLPEIKPVTYNQPSLLKKSVKHTEIFATKAIKHIPILRTSIGPLAYRILYKRQIRKLPQEVLDAWKYLNSIDSQTWPTNDAINGVRYHPLSFDQHNSSLGYIYKRLVDRLSSSHSDYLFFVPKLSTGGTEKVLFNYIHAIKKAHPDWHITILSSLPDSHPYAVPENVDFIDFDGITEGIDWYEKDVLWSRLLVQLGVKRLHVVNHEGWYRWLIAHKELLDKNSFIVNASMYMREFSEEPGRIRSFAEPYLDEVYPVLNKIFTDNSSIVGDIKQRDGFDAQKFSVHYQPFSLSAGLKKPRSIVVNNSKPLRILWASRLSFQKRPDIVKKIGEKIDPSKYQIDIYGREQHYNGQFFNAVKSINYKGSFNGIESIPIEEYDVYLYTSSVDGMPNILLEISSLGLPIIASNDGGVGEFVINNKTGLLCDIDNIDKYVDALEYIRSNPKKARSFAESSQKLLKMQHSTTEFEKKVAEDIQ